MENARTDQAFHHVPIMVREVMDLLQPGRGGVFVDGTLGGGGHSEAVLNLLPDGGRLLGIDRDETALRAASARLAPYRDRFTAVHGNFFHMRSLLLQRGITRVDGILLDLGVSSYQLDEASRGFSYRAEAPLDMRMDQGTSLTAADVVNGYPERSSFASSGTTARSGSLPRSPGASFSSEVRSPSRPPRSSATLSPGPSPPNSVSGNSNTRLAAVSRPFVSR